MSNKILNNKKLNETLPSTKVRPLISNRTGKPVVNQYSITVGNLVIFQSYNTRIAVKDMDTRQLTLDTNALDYSVTTSRYLYQFTGLNRTEIMKGINKGTIKVEELNW